MRQLKGTVLQALAHERIRCAAASCGVVGRREGWKPADRKPWAPPLTIESPSCAATRPPVVSIDRSVDREQLVSCGNLPHRVARRGRLYSMDLGGSTRCGSLGCQ